MRLLDVRRRAGAVIRTSALATATTMGCAHSTAKETREMKSSVAALRVCADPNNLPFSDARGEGFENKIAELLARDLHEPLQYTWRAQRRGFVRESLSAKQCDVIMGVPTHYQLTATTQPYYRSTYVFVTRAQHGPAIHSFNDPILRTTTIGVQMIGDDFANTPPAHALATRGIVQHVRGYTVYGDYRQPNPPARIVDAVAHGDVDVAIVWGPLAGYFAPREPVALRLTPVSPAMDPGLPFTFDISIGVRHTDTTFQKTLNHLLEIRRPVIDSILRAYGVPRVDTLAPPARTIAMAEPR